MKRNLILITVALIAVGISSKMAKAGSVSVVTTPAGLIVTADGTNYVAPVTLDWAAGSVHTLDAPSPQVAEDGHSRSMFVSWSDGGDQSHSVTVPGSDTTITASFRTQYLLDITVKPPGAGSVSISDPLGPWHDAGESLTLTALASTGYRLSYWQGANSQGGNTAQLTMDGYQAVQAGFVPADFPYIQVINNGGAAPGSLIGNLDGRSADSTQLYYVILDNTGTNVLFASRTNTLYRFVTPQGFDAFVAGSAFNLKDETLHVVDSVSTVGYKLDTHDMKLLPNGHALVFGTEVRTVDMSALVTGGRPAASVTGDVLQEIDANNQVVFEWHTFDHIPITDSFQNLTQQVLDYAHLNAMCIDPTDDNLIVSLRTTSEIVKINRQTGEVMWRLGGKKNEFTFVGEHQENAPYFTVGQHDIHRLPNGNLLYFDNGNISGGGVTPSDRSYSRAVEYQLDEVNKVATLVWEFRHSPDISAPCTGSVKRLANGNTLIGWGCAIPTKGTITTEVSPSGQVVFEVKHRVPPGTSPLTIGDGLTKQLWDSPDLIRSVTYEDIAAGQTYDAAAAGVSLTVNDLSGAAENSLVIERHLDAVRFPLFAEAAPQVVMEHVVLSGSNIVALQAEIELALPDTTTSFDTPIVRDPAQVVVYQRPIPGQGQFAELATTYDADTEKLRVTTTQLGEFIFAYPDSVQIPYTPELLSPADGSEIAQTTAINLSWTRNGLVSSFDLQVATNETFADPLIDTNGLATSSFSVQSPLPYTQYFWRVRAVNPAGVSDWASASFATVPPELHLIYPAGGEVWQRFQAVTIRWAANISDNVALDIYKDGVSNRNFLASTPNTGAYTWTVGQFQPFPSGSNYTIKIRSTISPDLYDFSAPFSMITNVTNLAINRASVTNLADGSVQFGFSVPGALEATVLGSTNLEDWEVLQIVPLTDGAAVFTDNTATNFPSRFYRLSVP